MVKLDRIGIAVRADSLAAIGLRRGRVHCAAAAALGPEAEIGSALSDLLSKQPFAGSRVSAVVAVGPAHCQIRPLHDLPPLGTPAAVEGLIRENLPRFFLRNGIPLTPSGAVSIEGTWWAAAFEEPLVDGLREACERSGTRLQAIVPAMSVIGPVLGVTELDWQDGEWSVRATYRDGRIAACHRVAPHVPPSHRVPEALSGFAGEEETFLDAYAGAVTGLHGIPRIAGRTPRGVPRWRKRLALALAAAATAFAVLAPGLKPRLAEARTERRLAGLARALRPALSVQGELDGFRFALGEFGALSGPGQRPVSRVLAAIARTLPDGAAVTNLSLDSVTVRVVILAPQAATVLARMERDAAFPNPAIEGAITRENTAAGERDRVTIRFGRR